MERKQLLCLAFQLPPQDQGVNLDIICDFSSVISEPCIPHQRWQHSSRSGSLEQLWQCGTALPLGLKELFNSHHYPLGLVCWRRVPSSDAFWSGTQLANLDGWIRAAVCFIWSAHRFLVRNLVCVSYQVAAAQLHSLRLAFHGARLSSDFGQPGNI